MPAPGDIGQRSNEIEELVTNGEFERAFVRLIDLAKEFARSDDQAHEAIILSGNFKSTAKRRRRDLISEDEFVKQRNKYLFACLRLKQEILDAFALELAV